VKKSVCVSHNETTTVENSDEEEEDEAIGKRQKTFKNWLVSL
jgi:hypothetical protein